MKRNNRIVILCSSILLTLANSPLLASENEIKNFEIAVPISAPFAYKNEQGEPAGFLVELFALLEQKSAVQANISIMPWPRAMHEVKVGHINALMPTIYTDERTDFFAYPKLPIFETNTVLLKRAQDNIAVDDITQLGTDKVIAKVRSTSVGKAFDDAEKAGLIKVIEVRDFDHAIQMLATSRVDLVICADHISSSSLNRLNLRDSIETINFSHGKVPAYLAFSKAFAAQYNIDSLMQKIKAIEDTAEYKILVSKYLKTI